MGLHAEKWLVFPEISAPAEHRRDFTERRRTVHDCHQQGRPWSKGALVAIIFGTKSEHVVAALNTMPEEARNTVSEITLDLSSSMRKIARLSFPKATQVIDRFHVQKLALEALQEMRIDFRWDAIHEENKLMAEYRAALRRGEDVEPYEPQVYANGDTRKQLLARSRYLLFKSREKWTESQKAEPRYSSACIRIWKPPMS